VIISQSKSNPEPEAIFVVDITEAKNDVTKDWNAQEEQSLQANIDMRFITTPGGMWEDFLVDDAYGDDRPRMEFDLTSDWVYRYYGQWVKNRAQVNFESNDDATSDDDADLASGVYKGDFREGFGKEAQDTAVREAVITGFGAYKITEEFVDEEDPENDQQRIVWQPINNAFNTVKFDHNAKRADKVDASRVQVLTAYTDDAYEREFPGFDAVSAHVPFTRGEFAWSTPEQTYVAERFEVVHKKEEMSVWRNVSGNLLKAYPMNEIDDIKEELKAFGWEHVRERDIKRRTIEKSVFNGNDFMEQGTRIAGKWLPIVPIYAYRNFVDGLEYYWGLVRKLKDGNRTVNMAISRMAEDSAASGSGVPILTEQQVRGRKTELADMTNKNYAVVNDIVDINGQPIYSGPVGSFPSRQVDPNGMAAVQLVSNFMQQKTGGASQDTFDPSVSGVAVEALVKEGNLSTVVIGDNILLSVEQDGRIWESKMSELYTSPMMKRSVGEDGTSKNVKLNQKQIIPGETEALDLNNLSKGRFAVHVEPGSQFDTQREATVESVEKVITAVSQIPDQSTVQELMFPLVGTWVQSLEGPGLAPLKDKVRKMMVLSGDIEPETDEEEAMVQQAQNQPDPQSDVNTALAENQRAEARNFDADSESKQATSMKNMATAKQSIATAEKIKAETAEIVVNINTQLEEGAAVRNFNRFARNASIPGGQ
jgi:hypothetical protein